MLRNYLNFLCDSLSFVRNLSFVYLYRLQNNLCINIYNTERKKCHIYEIGGVFICFGCSQNIKTLTQMSTLWNPKVNCFSHSFLYSLTHTLILLSEGMVVGNTLNLLKKVWLVLLLVSTFFFLPLILSFTKLQLGL